MITEGGAAIPLETLETTLHAFRNQEKTKQRSTIVFRINSFNLKTHVKFIYFFRRRKPFFFSLCSILLFLQYFLFSFKIPLQLLSLFGWMVSGLRIKSWWNLLVLSTQHSKHTKIEKSFNCFVLFDQITYRVIQSKLVVSNRAEINEKLIPIKIFP